MKEIELCGQDMPNYDTEAISEIIHNALLEKDIVTESFSWSVSVTYTGDDDE